ncbi:hypothetical protein [Aureivirga sp. CE67]|uniref:hypothetical protein n=1 Tax=Aureivirga sp. CE67 TaxID=1788983 RepID=UPI0018CA7D5F|nr:hypothetical protein [Aureivirga sp. CE67]
MEEDEINVLTEAQIEILKHIYISDNQFINEKDFLNQKEDLEILEEYDFIEKEDSKYFLTTEAYDFLESSKQDNFKPKTTRNYWVPIVILILIKVIFITTRLNNDVEIPKEVLNNMKIQVEKLSDSIMRVQNDSVFRRKENDTITNFKN